MNLHCSVVGTKIGTLCGLCVGDVFPYWRWYQNVVDLVFVSVRSGVHCDVLELFTEMRVRDDEVGVRSPSLEPIASGIAGVHTILSDS